MPITLDNLLARLPLGVERQVRTTRDRARQLIRDALIAECGLSMRGLGDADDRDARGQVPVNIQRGYPESLTFVTFPDDLERVLLLARYGRQLAATASAKDGLLKLHRELLALKHGDAWAMKTDTPIHETGKWASEMLAHVEQLDPVKKILAFNEDVLGIYRFVNSARDEFAPNRAGIDLYWGVIGIVSDMMHCTVEDLTVVVLAHEMAHAYTQLGADTDGRRWHATLFGKAERALVEGLAQYYAERTLKRLHTRFPAAHGVFLNLLAKQSAPYHAHEAWAPHVAPEAVRRAMLEVRRSGELTLAQFESRLEQAAKEFVLTPSDDSQRG